MSQEGKNKGGRPLKFKTVKELQTKIDAYFEYCDPHESEELQVVPIYKDKKRVGEEIKKVKTVSQQRPYTITGLAYWLDTSRETLLNYEENSKYFDTIKKAKERIHNFTEEKLYGGAHPTGVIFNLKNNWGWKDKTEVEESGEKHIVVETRFAKKKKNDTND